MAEGEIIEKQSWLWSWWSPMSSTVLRSAEKRLLSCLKTAYRGWYVDIGSVVGKADKIWTICLNQDSNKTPLVLLHGLGAGVGLWCLNLDAFAAHRPVYAIDILGFGRSSRPDFSSDAEEAEKQLVKSVEEWRNEMKLPKMILLGHSMGGYIAASYAITYPDRVKHLILADPWGFTDRPEDLEERKSKMPLWARALFVTLQPLNPLWAIRTAGPFGQKLIERARPDLISKFSSAVDGDVQAVSQYIFQCNAQKPSGEAAFHSLMSGFGWAKNPMVRRMEQLRSDIPVTLLYGSRSWVDNRAGHTIKEKRPADSYTDVKTIMGAGHHVYADKSDIFNSYVNKTCKFADGDVDSVESPTSDDNHNVKSSDDAATENQASSDKIKNNENIKI